MILGKKVAVPIFVLFMLFTSMFISLVSIYYMPERMMGSSGVYVLTSSKDKNPIRSNLDIGIAYGLENMSYVESVSPEIFVFTVIHNQPVTIRGVMFKKFLNLENGKIVAGTIPHTINGAMVGIHAAKKLDIHIGDNLTVYGSFTTAIAIIHIVGVYDTHDPADDELIVSLPTARKLSGIHSGEVSIIRVKTNNANKIDKLMNPTYPKFKAKVKAPSQIYVGADLNFSVTIKNMGKDAGAASISIGFQDRYYNTTEQVQNNKTITLSMPALRSGKYNITAVVKNDVFYYTCYTQVSVLKKPVLIQGPSFAYIDTPTNYSLTTINNESITSGKLIVKGTNYTKYYDVNGSATVLFPRAGNYTINYYGEEYMNKSINVSVYARVAVAKVARIIPEPINGTIYIARSSSIKILTNGTAYYSVDNSSYIEGTVLNTNLTAMKNHVFGVRIIYHHFMAEDRYLLHIIENTSPKIMAPVSNGSRVVYGENITFEFKDVLPIRYISYTLNGHSIIIPTNQSFNPYIWNYTYNLTLTVNSTKFAISLVMEDAWNRSASYSVHCTVVLEQDIIKPEIIVHNVTIWGGNRTLVEAEDNEGVANISVRFYGHYFNSTSNSVYVYTMFRNGNTVSFVPEGKYIATVVVYDISGNMNITNFTITIDNTNEKNPPVIVGKTLVDLSKGYTIYSAFDNVGVLNITAYENGTRIKSSNSATLNLTTADFTNGVHHITIEALDVNYNYGVYSVVIVKNYTDTIPPTISAGPLNIWGGNSTEVRASDNVKVSSISVYVFGRYFNGTRTAIIKTVFVKRGSIEYMPPGTYSMRVLARDVYGNENSTLMHLTINNTNERNPPVFLHKDFEIYNASENITIKAFDNVGVKLMWVVYKHHTIFSTQGNTTSFRASLLPCGYSSIDVFAEDYNANVNNISMRVLIKDDIKPWLIENTSTVWSGNYTVIHGADNVRVAKMSVNFDGMTIASSNGTLVVPTKHVTRSQIKYMPAGHYSLSVKLVDSSGNVNVSHFELIINNTGEKIPPVIFGPAYGSLNRTSSITYYAVDNVQVAAIWLVENGSVLARKNSTSITLTNHELPGGWHNITVVAEDVNGNIATFNSSVYVVRMRTVEVSLRLENKKLSTKDQGILLIDIKNQNIAGYYRLTVNLDGTVYYQQRLYLKAYEQKSLYIYLPYLSEGKHTVSVGNNTLSFDVKKSIVEKLPTDLVLKYAKNLKFSESKSVVYKGFEISEGNFILVIGALIGVTALLLFFGLYSTVIKSVNTTNVGILRAIGASHRQILVFLVKDSSKYAILPLILGIVGGYALVLAVDAMDVLTAFGHQLIIVPTIGDIVAVVVLSLIFIISAMFAVFRYLVKGRVIHIMGKEENPQTVMLDNLLD